MKIKYIKLREKYKNKPIIKIYNFTNMFSVLKWNAIKFHLAAKSNNEYQIRQKYVSVVSETFNYPWNIYCHFV